jgi:uncharacterized membrane protein YjjP (DUF1212 family)
LQILSAGVAAGLFALLLGGGLLREALPACFCCAAICALQLFVKQSASVLFVTNIASGALAGLCAMLAASLFGADAQTLLLGAMLPFFPGVAMMNAIRDTIAGDLVSGLARGAEAALCAVGLAIGAAGIFAFVSPFLSFGAPSAVVPTGLHYALLGGLISLFIGFTLNARPKIALWGAAIGGAAYAVFLFSGGGLYAYFWAAAALALLSNVAARRLKTPATLFLILGVYPLVPGAGVYKTVMALFPGGSVPARAVGGETAAAILFMVAAIAIVEVLSAKK